MSASKVTGRDVVLKIMKVLDATYYVLLCGQEVVFNLQTEQLAATGPDAGSWSRFKPGKTTWGVSFSGLTMIEDTTGGEWTVFELTDDLPRQEGVDLQVIFTSESGETQDYQGHANPESASITGSVPGGALSKWTMSFKGDGPLARNASVPDSNTNDVNRYEYTATGGETFFTVPALISKTILDFQRETGSAIHIITSGTPSVKQVKYTSASGRFDVSVDNVLGAGEQIIIEYR